MPDKKITAAQIALWADRLRDQSALGLRFTNAFYDQEIYRTIQDISMEMFAAVTAESLDDLEPLRTPIFSRPTPFSAADAAVINGKGEILLIQRGDNEKWAMPGGALEVGETPAEGAAREVLEETGVVCEITALVGIFDSRLCGTLSRHHLYQFCFLGKPVEGTEQVDATHRLEVLDAGWFPETNLPKDIDPGHIGRIPIAFKVWRGEIPAYFDR